MKNFPGAYMLKRYLVEKNLPRSLAGSIFLGMLVIVLCLGCQSDADEDKNFTSPPGYNLNKPRVFKLPPVLDEISGIAFNKKDRSILAINDEFGWLYKIHLKSDVELEKWQYSKGADFEDLVLVDSTFYVLESNGSILEFTFLRPDSVNVKEHVFPVTGKNEFEILYHDKKKNKLILLCKNCEQDDKNSLTAFAFDMDSSAFASSPAYVMDIRKIEDLMDEKKLRYKPSAATVHPLTGELFIISSINKVLVVADINGNPKAVYRVNPKLYKQPEGMAFTPQGDLFISNESADIGAANILYFKRTGK